MTEQMNVKRTYGILDVVKFIMALLVVTIHRRLGSEDSLFIFEEVNVLARIAVPFFFASSSYLFFSKINRLGTLEQKQLALERYVIRMLRILLIWSIVYLPSQFYRYKIYNKLPWKETIPMLLKYPDHLWFLAALAVSVVIVYYATRKSSRPIGIIAVILFIFSVLAGFNKFYYDNFTLFYNILFAGIPYIFLGYYLANQTKKCSLKLSIALFFVFLILSFVEGFIEYKFLNNTFFGFSRICYLPTVYFLLTICLSVNTKERKIYLVLRKASMFIYFVHLVLYREIIWLILYIFGLDSIFNNKLALFAITIAYTTIALVLLLLLENKKGFKWLKKLYN